MLCGRVRHAPDDRRHRPQLHPHAGGAPPRAGRLCGAAVFHHQGLSGVVVYNALVIVDVADLSSRPRWRSTASGRRSALSVPTGSAAAPRRESLEQKLAEHPKLQKYFSAAGIRLSFCFAIHLIGLSMEVLGILLRHAAHRLLTYLKLVARHHPRHGLLHDRGRS